MRKSWQAYRKLIRVSDYVYSRGLEVLQKGGRRVLPMSRFDKEYEW
jgi:hypothetical protein